MIYLEQVRLPIVYTDSDVSNAVALRLGIAKKAVRYAEVVRRGVDARRRPALSLACGVVAECGAELEGRLIRGARAAEYVRHPRLIEELRFWKENALKEEPPTVVVGSGPAGLFCALALAKMGAKPLVVERGGDCETRAREIARLTESGILNPECNVQFGLGGAGTFSDGKLNTGITSPYARIVLGEFVRHGAPPEIEILSKPHIGTDYLAPTVTAIKDEIEALGGRFLFHTRLTGLVIRDGKIAGAKLEGLHGGTVDCSKLYLGIGHSARDTFEMLAGIGVVMTAKPFAVGLRVEHLQEKINLSQYGTPTPPFAADYKLATQGTCGRGVFSFCMCPGGVVMASASEAGGVTTNGMSEFARAGKNANSAVLVGVDTRDYGEGLFAGVAFQRSLERLAYAAGGGGFRAPGCRMEDFLAGRASSAFGEVRPSYRPGVTPCNLSALLPQGITASIQAGIRVFDGKLAGFAHPDAVLTGPETRSSSPIRICRDTDGESSVKGLFPIGEGAGYAGGILSAAVDGLSAVFKTLDKRVCPKS